MKSSLRLPLQILLFLFLSLAPARAMVDLNGNGISDVWEFLYSVPGINPANDDDNDGFSNLQEYIAGTNPDDPNSYPALTAMSFTSSNVSLSMNAVLGKQYTLYSATTVNGTNWNAETNFVVRSGATVTLSATVTNSTLFYRIGISDADTDGDGLTDWEEYQLGLDPLNPHSNLNQDTNGNPISDYAYVTNMLASQNLITLTAPLPVASEPDPGENPNVTGQFTVTRGGFPFGVLTVFLNTVGSGNGFANPGVDYETLPPTVTFNTGETTENIQVLPMSNPGLGTPVLAEWELAPWPSYTIGSPNIASVVIYPTPTSTGTGLLGQYFTNSSTTYTNSKNFNPTNLVRTRIDPTINFNWTNGMTPNLSNGYYSVRWTGQLEPQFSEPYVFAAQTDDGCRLWVNDQLLIDKWQSQGLTTWTNVINLLGGTRYDLRFEYLQNGGAAQAHLFWYSPSQPEQIIPTTSLYPTNFYGTSTSNGPAVITSAMSAVAFLGQPFTFTVTGANTPRVFTASGLPPGLTFSSTNGVISGTPTAVGSFQVTLTASNAIGLGASVLTINVLNTGYSVVEEVWTNVSGTNISDIPLSTPANVTNVLGRLAESNYGINYGERIRGYFTAPATGNYYFWISGSDSAQLWISDDSQPVNAVLRASVYPSPNPQAPPNYGTAIRSWYVQTNQQSGWLYLQAGQSYFIEVLHKSGIETNDNWAVGYLQDPTGTNTVPSGLPPAYLLSRYYSPLIGPMNGTLYTANMLALPGVTSDGVGSATLLLNNAGTQATLNFQFNNLVGAVSGEAINSDPYQLDPSELIFDISAATPNPDGSFTWVIEGMGPLGASDILQIINQGGASILIQTAAFPGGEIGGHFVLAEGSQNFTPPPAPPLWTDDSAHPNAAVRFLTQATFGPGTNDIASVKALGYAGWLAHQFALPATHHLPYVLANPYSDPTDLYQSPLWFSSWWSNSINAPDQLRQRVAFALSEIFVLSENSSALVNHADGLSSYYDMLIDHAFGNYRSLIEAVTLHPAMGLYLNMLENNAGSEITGLHANENYAREIQQLFSVGLNREWPDGSLILNSSNNLVPTYGQNEIMGFASVFTGWSYSQAYQTNGRLPSNFYPPANYTSPMVLVPSHHEQGTKLVLDNVMLPAAQGSQTSVSSTNYDTYGLNDLEAALNSIYNNQNVGPYICRQLIQRLVTSNPSHDYVYRVVQVFNNDGAGVRGNLQAVVQAILLDYEARSPNLLSNPTFGKQREPLLRVTDLARAFPAPPIMSGTYSQTTNQTITIATPKPHLLGSGDTVRINFTDTSGNAPPTAQGYGVTVTTPTNFTVNAPQLSVGTYTQSNGMITPNIANNGLLVGNPVYLQFTTGGASNGLYTVITVIDTAHFTVNTSDTAIRSGSCLLPKITAGGYTQTKTNIVVSTSGPHDLVVGNTVFINFTSGTAVDGIYQVAAVSDLTHFTVITTNSASQNKNSLLVYSLSPPTLNRSGTVSIQQGTWSVGYTDTGTTSSLSQSPLRSPTVFNFFYPGYEFPGVLAAAGLTTPEFQLTTASGINAQMNFIEGGILNNTGNTNGLCSYTGGNGTIVLNFFPWMKTNYTANAGIPTLVSNLSTLLMAGQLSSAAQTAIVKFVASTNFGYSTPPTQTQMRDRVRAVVHQIVNSPDYVIQK